MKTYEKLVRDDIPLVIKRKGEEVPPYRQPKDDSEYEHFLRMKMAEEQEEFRQAETSNAKVMELVDIMEVCYAEALRLGFPRRQVDRMCAEKYIDRGGFEGRVVMTLPRPEKHSSAELAQCVGCFDLVDKSGDWCAYCTEKMAEWEQVTCGRRSTPHTYGTHGRGYPCIDPKKTLNDIIEQVRAPAGTERPGPSGHLWECGAVKEGRLDVNQPCPHAKKGLRCGDCRYLWVGGKRWYR